MSDEVGQVGNVRTRWSGDKMAELAEIVQEMNEETEDQDEPVLNEPVLDEVEQLLGNPWTGSSVDQVACPQCGRIVSRQGLGSHQRVHRATPKWSKDELTCSVCGKGFKSPTSYGAHRRSVHGIFGGVSGRSTLGNRRTRSQLMTEEKPLMPKAEVELGEVVAERVVPRMPKLRHEPNLMIMTDDEGGIYLVEKIR